jgi:uncharacterized protein YukE
VSVAQAGTGAATHAGLPWPEGDPGSLARSASAVGSGADSLRTAAVRLKAEASRATGWRGAAANAFRSAVAQDHALMTKGAGALEQGAAALKHLSNVLDKAQDRVRALAREVVEAEEAADQAAARAALASLAAVAAGVELTLAGPHPGAALRNAAADASDDAALADSAAGDARAHAEAVRARNTRQAEDAVDDVLRQDRATAAALDAATAAAPLAGVPVGAPTAATGFAQVALTGLTLEQWRAIAYWRAGIDSSTWQPTDGLLANDATVQAVYRYYGNLYLDHPELQWAGMANIVGPMFYAGWQDMYAIRHLADPGERAEYLSRWVGLPTLPDPVYDAATALAVMPPGFLNPFELAEHLTAEEIEWYEDRFLRMQREIFDDLAWQHEAFVLGGAPLLREIGSRYPNELPARDVDAWEDIGSGDPERVKTGNTDLLMREQERVIQDDYDAMRDHHGPVGDVFTYGFSTMAENPIPGGRAYRDYDPIVLTVDLVPDVPVGPLGPLGPHIDIPTPDVEVHQTLPLPAGNLSNFEDRWGWIENDMLPRYHELLQDPHATRALVSSDVAERASDYRKLPDLHYPGG